MKVWKFVDHLNDYICFSIRTLLHGFSYQSLAFMLIYCRYMRLSSLYSRSRPPSYLHIRFPYPFFPSAYMRLVQGL